MPYIILSANGEEIQRAELTGSLVVGRSSECHVPVRDVLMSRRHCRIERGAGKDKGRWVFVDLDSRNGSHVNWKKIARYPLVDGDAVRMGRSWLTFKSGPFEPAAPEAKKRVNKLVRPADPHEALSGTVADFVFVDRDDAGAEFDAAPSPRGKQAAGGKTIYSPLQELSSSWDSIVTTAAAQKPRARPIPRRSEDVRPLPRREADVSLHAHPIQIPYLEVVPAVKRRRFDPMPALILTVGIGAATLLVLVSGWVMTKG